jgi:hypothetical protein
MPHPPVEGHGDPGNFASRNPANNIGYGVIESINSVLPQHFNGMIIEATGCYAYQQTATQDGPNPAVITIDEALADATTNASPMAFLGNFTGGGFSTPPYLIALSYKMLLEALSSGDVSQLQQWYQLHFPNPGSNWQNFLNSIGISQAVASAIKNALAAAAAGLPTI